MKPQEILKVLKKFKDELDPRSKAEELGISEEHAEIYTAGFKAGVSLAIIAIRINSAEDIAVDNNEEDSSEDALH